MLELYASLVERRIVSYGMPVLRHEPVPEFDLQFLDEEGKGYEACPGFAHEPRVLVDDAVPLPLVLVDMGECLGET